MIRIARLTLIVLATVVLFVGPVCAQKSSFSADQRAEIIASIREALRQDPTILRDAVSALQDDESRQQNQAMAGILRNFSQELAHKDGDPVAGNPKGTITIVEFSDVRCPYCRRMIPTLAQLSQSNKDVRIVYKDLPVLGPASVLGARAELAALKQDAYARMHLALMTGTSSITEDVVHSLANKLGLDWSRLVADMKSQDVQDRIDANLALAKRLDLQGTPAYVIGDILLPGAVELADLQRAVAQQRRQN